MLTSTVAIRRFDGTLIADAISLTTPAGGVTNYNLCQNDPTNSYGSVEVTPVSADTITGYVLRQPASNDYKVATELRAQ